MTCSSCMKYGLRFNSCVVRNIFYVLFLFLLIHSGFSQEPDMPKSVKKSIIKGDGFLKQLEYKNAVKCYIKASEQWDEDVQLQIKIARCYSKLNNPEEAEIWYYKVVNSNTEIDPVFYLNYGEILIKNKKYTEAREWFVKYNMLVEEYDLRASHYLKSIEDINKYFNDSSFYIVEPVNINSQEADISPALYNNDLFFLSSRKNDNKSSNDFDIFYAPGNNENQFSDPVRIDDLNLNTAHNEGQISFIPNINELIFTRYENKINKLVNTEKDISSSQLYKAEYGESVFDIRNVSLFTIENFNYSLGFPAINSANNYLVFVSNDLSGQGKLDLYVSYFINGSWSFPINMGNDINTKGDEMFPCLYNDSILYFASNGHGGLGGLDIFRANLNQRPYQIVNLGYPINSSWDDYGLIFSDNKLKGYFTSNRPGGKGSDDIYSFEIMKFLVKGIFTDENTGDNLKEINLKITLNDTLNSELVLMDNGSFQLEASPGDSYYIDVTKDKYKPKHFYVSTNAATGSDMHNMNLGEIELERIEEQQLTAFEPNLYYQEQSNIDLINATEISKNLSDDITETKEIQETKGESEKDELSQRVELETKELTEIVETEPENDELIEITETIPETYYTENETKEEPEPEIISRENMTIFRVQIAASQVPLSREKLNKLYSGNRDIYEFQEDIWYKYAIGDFDSYFEANELKKNCGVKNCFIAAYSGDTKLVLMQAIKDKTKEFVNNFMNSDNVLAADTSDIVLHETIYFNLDEFEIMNSERLKIGDIIEKLQRDSSLMIEINGHTDKLGSKDYNLGLSLERAKNLYKYLVDNGVTPNRIIVRSFGENNLAKQCYSNCPASVHKLNRRAELILFRRGLDSM